MKAFEEATKDRMRKNLLKYTYPKAMKAVEEAERLGEEVSTKNPRIENAFILDEIANHGRPATPVPPELFDAACRAKRSKLSPHFLDPLLYAAITQWGWHARFTYQQMADELWKLEAVRMFFKNKKIKEGCIS